MSTYARRARFTTKSRSPMTKTIRAGGARSAAPLLARRRPMRHRMKRRVAYRGKRLHRRGRGLRNARGSGSSYRTNSVAVRNLSGMPDSYFCKLKLTTTSAFTLAGGAPTFQVVKLNSIYRPLSGLTTNNPGGYARMFADYQQVTVRASKISVRLWASGAAGAVQEPFRMVAIPCNPTQSGTYTGVSNIATLMEVPHCKHRLFSPGATMPNLTHYCNQAAIQYGSAKQDDLILTFGNSHTAGVDPTNINYWVIGFQTMAGTTTLDLQAEYSIECYCEFIKPIASNQLSITSFGEPPEEKKAAQEEKKEEPEFELIRIPKKPAATPVGSKK